MGTVLLMDDDGCTLRRQQCRWYHPLLTLIRARRLDRELESGADPDASLELSLRARALIAPSHRRRLARTLRQLAREAERSPHPLSSRVRLARREILQARDLVEEAARLLVSRSPANASGVARVQVLLQDGASPLYRPDAPGALGVSLAAAIDALTEPPAIPAGL